VTAAVLAAAAAGPLAAQQSVPDLSALEFRLIGPVNPSGRVTDLAVPDTPGRKTIYAGFASSGVWKTTNLGTTWEPIFDDQGTSTVGALAVAPSDPNIVWVGTGERNSLRSNQWGDGVYRSTDGGRTWRHMGLTETRETGRIVVHPEDPGLVYVAALGHLWGPNPERGVYRTRDGGETWEQILFVDDTTGFVDLKMDPENPDILYAAAWHRLRWGGGRMEGAGAGSGIYRSMDGGDTWTRLTDGERGLPASHMGRIGLSISRSRPETVYAVIQVSRSTWDASISTHGGVFRSDDRGETWRRVHDISAVPDYYYNELWVDPQNPDRVWAGATFMARSDDGGTTFEPQRWRGVHVDHHALWIDPDDTDHLVLGNDGGVYISWDGGRTWDHQRIPASQMYEVDVDTTKVPYHVCAGHQDNGTWCGPSRTRERIGITEADWYSVWGGDGFHSQISADDPRVRYHASQYGNVVRLNTETREVKRLQPLAEDAGAESGYPFRWDWNTPFVLSHHDPTVLYLGGNHLFKLTDRGEDWTILGPDMTRGNRFAPEPDSGHTSYRSLHSVAESTLSASILWTGSNDGLIWTSRDGGETWHNVTANIPQVPPQRCWVGEIEPSHHDTATAYVVYDCHRRDDYRPYVFRTTDGGETWTDISANLPEDKGSYVIREDRVNPNLLFVGNENGVWVSLDGGGAWTRLDNGLPTVPVKDMDPVWRRSELVVGTYGRGAYVLDIAPLQQMSADVLARPAHLFRPLPVRQYAMQSTYGSRGNSLFAAPNPPYGATLWYYLAEDAGDEVTLTVRRMGDDGRPGETVKRLTGPGKAGLGSVQWDLSRDRPRSRRLGEDPQSLRTVLPGTFEVTLRVGGETYTTTVEVVAGWEERTPGRVR